MKKNLFAILFISSVLGVFSGIILQLKWLDYVFKPIIMISIAGYFLTYIKHIPKNIVKPALFAFLLSLMGDIFMMLTEKGMPYFLLGLTSFLIAQLVYIQVFFRSVKLGDGAGFLSKNYIYLIFYFVFGGIVFYFLFPRLDLVMRVAILLYIIAISAMSAMALNRYKIVNSLSFKLVFFGTIFFMISDTLIALNVFYTPIPYHRLYTMSTYISAQFLIMMGILKQFDTKY